MPKLLVVEDDTMNREMLRKLLSMLGYDVITAADGARGLAMARAEQPDLIILDMGLPVLNGWQVAHRAKSHPHLCRIPIIALTAYALREDRQRSLDAGCDEYETKPVDLDRLHAKIEAQIAGAVAARA